MHRSSLSVIVSLLVAIIAIFAGAVNASPTSKHRGSSSWSSSSNSASDWRLSTTDLIRAKKQQYCFGVDNKRLDLLRRVALPDANFTLNLPASQTGGQGAKTFEFGSLDGFLEFYLAALNGRESVHLVDSGSFELAGGGGKDDDDEVRVRFVLISFAGQKSTATKGADHLVLGGSYYDTFRKVRGEWFLAASEVSFTYDSTFAVLPSA